LSIQAISLDYSSSGSTIVPSLLGCTDWHALKRSAGALTITERSYRRPFWMEKTSDKFSTVLA